MMMKYQTGLFMSCMMLFSICMPLCASGQAAATGADVYPKVGLVLSGGGARGFAHIGALKVLEAIGMPIDYIVGTSMGSIVGGLYAIGYSAQEIEQITLDADWEALFSDTPPRELWSYQQKRASAKYILGVEFSKKGFIMPMGLTAGQKISNMMAFLTLRASEIDRFDDFPIPYRAVAADIVTGAEVVLEHGSLADAMRASMSVPGVFTPMTIDDHLLVDGGVVNNLPVDVAKRMGADIVIAIDISTPLNDKDKLSNPVAILNQMVGLQMVRVTEAQRQLADVVIIPDLLNYSSSSFGNAAEIIPLGEYATKLQLQELQEVIQRLRTRRPASRPPSKRALQDVTDVYIEDIAIEGNLTGNEELLLKQMQPQKGRTIDRALLEQKITEIFSTGNYETVTFKLTAGRAEGKTLTLQLQERKQGPHLIRFGLNYESRFDDAEEDKMRFLANVTLKNLTGAGSSWSTDLQFVNVMKVESEYIHPLWKGFYVAPMLYRFNDFQTIYQGKTSVARYDTEEWGGGLRFGTFIRRFGEMSFGFLLEYVNAAPTTAVGEEFPEFEETLTSLIVRSRLDMLDTFPFPTTGRMLYIDYQLANQSLGGDLDFQKLAIEYWRYFSIGKRNTFGLRLQAGTSFNTELRPYKAFLLGGRDSFVGYKIEEQFGSHLAIAALEYRYRLDDLPSAVGGGIFLSMIANVGNVWKTTAEITEDFTLRYGGSIGLGVDTILGPVRADFALGDEGRKTIYLNIGYNF